MSEFQVYEKRKARKEHKCNMCNAKIEKGEIYQINKGVHDGEWFQSIECMACQPVIQEYCKFDHSQDGYCDEWVQEWWIDEKCPQCQKYYKPCIKENGDCDYDEYTNGVCDLKTDDGKCKDEICDDMTHYCRCENFIAKLK